MTFDGPDGLGEHPLEPNVFRRPRSTAAPAGPERVQRMPFELKIVGGQHPTDEFAALDQMDQLDQVAAHHGGQGAGPWTYRFPSQDSAQNAAREIRELGFATIRIKPIDETR